MLQQNQAKAVFCHGLAPKEQSCSTCDHDHTHLIEFEHACSYMYYSSVATISFIEFQVRLLFEGGYYSGCGFYQNKYGMLSLGENPIQ